jgi:hypothetical protein
MPVVTGLAPRGTLPSPQESRIPEVIGALTSLLIVALITYALRIYSRLKSHRGLALDDYAITIGLVSLNLKSVAF